MNCAIIRLDQSGRRSVSVKLFVQPCGTRHSGVRLENETQADLILILKGTLHTAWVLVIYSIVDDESLSQSENGIRDRPLVDLYYIHVMLLANGHH